MQGPREQRVAVITRLVMAVVRTSSSLAFIVPANGQVTIYITKKMLTEGLYKRDGSHPTPHEAVRGGNRVCLF